MNDRDSAKLDEMETAGERDHAGDNGKDGGSRSVPPAVEVATVSVGSMIRMATVDK